MAFDRLFEATVNRNADCVSFNADKKTTSSRQDLSYLGEMMGPTKGSGSRALSLAGALRFGLSTAIVDDGRLTGVDSK